MIRKTVKRPRSWSCSHCPQKNDPAKKKCGGCGIGRATKRKSLSTRCDFLWAQVVKAGGRCEAGGKCPLASDGGYAYPALLCSGALEAAHVVPRRHRTTRWMPENGRALCHGHHYFFTNHEKAWRDFIGPDWDRLWVKAQERWTGEFPIAELRAALAAKKEAA